jgi:hypothetical protein
LEVYFSYTFKEITYIASSVLYFLLLSSLSSSTAGTNSVNIYPPGSKPYGLSYEQHIKNFWRWLISLPKDKNPYQDQTGEKCANEQYGTNSLVFYLSGNGGGKSDRTCRVPAGKGLLIPVMIVEISDKEVPNKSVEDLHRFTKKDQDSVTNLYLKINDKEYNREELSKYRTHTGDFEVAFPKNAIFGASEGISKSVADGHYIITEPLTKGTYTIQYKSSLQPNFAQDIKYTIIAE